MKQVSMKKRDPWLICPVCDGEGKTVNPDIDANGLTREDFDEDPDFAEDYRSGLYDITCAACNGQRVVKRQRLRQLEQAAEDRRLAARENGDFEAYRVANDWRYGG
jgi:hypothetical protein